MKKQTTHQRFWIVPIFVLIGVMLYGCAGKGDFSSNADAAQKVYVAPGEYDEFYGFLSGGYNGQLGVYGIPSGRHLFTIPVFSQAGVNGYGYSEETKNMLNTTHGFVPWGDAHHPELSQTNGETDGRWIFINENNTPRIARIGLDEFRTQEIIEIPNSAGNHASAFVTGNTEYVIAATRFSIPLDENMSNMDVPIDSYKENFRGSISFIKVSKEGKMSVDFQILMPGFDYDLSHAGKGPSDGWSFFTSYNSEQAHTLLEINASRSDKDFIAAINWRKAAEYAKEGKGKMMPGKHVRNYVDREDGNIVKTEVINEVRVLDPRELDGIVYFLPTPKSPHGVDVDPTGKYIIAGGKLSTIIPVHSFAKLMKAIEAEDYEGEVMGIPVLKYDSILHGEVENSGLGPLHTEFDGRGYAYTTAFISSEIVKWDIEKTEVVDRIDTYYSPGHLMIPGGDTRKPDGKYLIALNKITKDRYLPTGPELFHSAQLFDISGDKMKLLLDFPTEGEPHYGQGILAEKVIKRQIRFYDLKDNTHPYKATSEKQTRVERDGNEVHVYMTAIRSHFVPDNIEGIRVGDKVYFHVTNLEQDWDVPHGFAIKGARNSGLLVMPGETLTLTWEPREVGIIPFYCTDFCSALHQEMQGYVRVSPKDSKTPIKYGTGQ